MQLRSEPVLLLESVGCFRRFSGLFAAFISAPVCAKSLIYRSRWMFVRHIFATPLPHPPVSPHFTPCRPMSPQNCIVTGICKVESRVRAIFRFDIGDHPDQTISRSVVRPARTLGGSPPTPVSTVSTDETKDLAGIQPTVNRSPNVPCRTQNTTESSVAPGIDSG